jgi:hypothetical protein
LTAFLPALSGNFNFFKAISQGGARDFTVCIIGLKPSHPDMSFRFGAAALEIAGR